MLVTSKEEDRPLPHGTPKYRFSYTPIYLLFLPGDSLTFLRTFRDRVVVSVVVPEQVSDRNVLHRRSARGVTGRVFLTLVVSVCQLLSRVSTKRICIIIQTNIRWGDVQSNYKLRQVYT